MYEVEDPIKAYFVKEPVVRGERRLPRAHPEDLRVPRTRPVLLLLHGR